MSMKTGFINNGKVVSYQLFLIEIPTVQNEFVSLKFIEINSHFKLEAIVFIKYFCTTSL